MAELLLGVISLGRRNPAIVEAAALRQVPFLRDREIS
jgi:hypothetical protein